MISKSTLLRLLCLAVLVAAASFGVFTTTAQPVHALECAPVFTGCTFTHIQFGPNGACCMYECPPNGTPRRGMCEE